MPGVVLLLAKVADELAICTVLIDADRQQQLLLMMWVGAVQVLY